MQALPNSVPAVVRLRHLLKLALRVCCLRCLRVEEVPADVPAAPSAGERDPRTTEGTDRR